MTAELNYQAIGHGFVCDLEAQVAAHPGRWIYAQAIICLRRTEVCCLWDANRGRRIRGAASLLLRSWAGTAFRPKLRGRRMGRAKRNPSSPIAGSVGVRHQRGVPDAFRRCARRYGVTRPVFGTAHAQWWTRIGKESALASSRQTVRRVNDRRRRVTERYPGIGLRTPQVRNGYGLGRSLIPNATE